jgi:hypothetical protein
MRRRDMPIWRVLYWLVTGALVGFGFIGILSIGLPFLLVGLAMVVFGAIRLGGSGIWALLVGLGGLPTAFLIIDIVTAPPPCPPGGTLPFRLPSGALAYSCSGPMNSYYVMAAIFGAIALVGLIWGFVAWRWRH